MTKLYSDLKIFHFDSKIKDILAGILSPPLHVRLKPTNKCNHNCYYCCYRNKDLYLSQLFNENDEIPKSKMREIVEDLRQMGIKAVTFSGGGEPLCYPYIAETAENLINAGIKIAVLTNGSLLKGKIAEALGKEIAWVRVSMDALDSQMYAKNRGVGLGEFDIVCNNIHNFAKNKSKQCQLGINFVVTQENYRDVYEFLKLMKKFGANHVKISESIVSIKKEENKKYYFSFSNSVKKQIARGLVDLSGNGFTIIDKFNNFDDKDSCYEKKYSYCPFIQCLTVIGADMNVYSCQDKAYTKNGRIGSIKNKGFQELWFSEKTKEKLFNLNPSKECNHHCTQHSKNRILFAYLDVNRAHLEFV